MGNGLSLGRVVIRAAKRVDHTIGRLTSQRTVLVDVRTPMNLAVMRPVWRRLADDARIAVLFTAEDEAGAAATLEAEGLRGALIPRRAASWRRLDLAVTADLWNNVDLHRCRRRLNFFHGVAGKYDLDHPERLGESQLSRFDRIAFINTDRMNRYLAAGAVRPDQAVLVGFPKLDALVNGTWSGRELLRDAGLDARCPTVLYAPTFSTAGSLQGSGEAIVGALLDTGCNVLVKLHDRSSRQDDKHTGGIDWPARLDARFGPHPRFALLRSADAGPALAAADVLITDHSTVGFEFALLDRPIVVYDAPALKTAARIDDEKWNLLRSMADVVADPAELRQAVELALANPSRRTEDRAAAHALFAHAGTATQRALAVAYELLEVPAAAGLVTPLRAFSPPPPAPPARSRPDVVS